MEKSKEVIFCKQLFLLLGREEKEKLLQKSNLTDREQKLFTNRFVHGQTLQETADEMNLTLDTINKIQKKAFCKLYLWLEIQFRLMNHKEK